MVVFCYVIIDSQCVGECMVSYYGWRAPGQYEGGVGNHVSSFLLKPCSYWFLYVKEIHKIWMRQQAWHNSFDMAG